MWTLGGTLQARAWSAWARPISPPSAVTAALFDMFCGLNGRTARPHRVNARPRPATISDLPTSEPVPWNMIAGARRISELDPGLGLDAGAERMLDQRHLGHEIGGLDQCWRRVATGEYSVLSGRARGQRCQNR